MKIIIIYSIFMTCFILNAVALSRDTIDASTKRATSAQKKIDSIANIEQKEISVVESFKYMFLDGQVSGQFRSIYADYNYIRESTDDVFATAVGGILKYELAVYKGFNAGTAIYVSNDVPFATGKGVNKNNELSSSDSSYMEMAELYINYKYNEFNFRAGRQVLNTPLADSDDIRMIQNTFEAYVATYKLENLKIMAGNIQSWQGFDVGLDTPWVQTGDKGTNFGGIEYSNGVEFNLWYYNMTGKANALYFDTGYTYTISKKISTHLMVQYLAQYELSQSGTQAIIYGSVFELNLYGLGMSVAYNKALVDENKVSFTGFGGGILFTNLDDIILDNLAVGRDAEVIVYGLTYSMDDFGLLYAYGDFWSESQNIIEQNIGMQYDVTNKFLIMGLYVLQENVRSQIQTDNDWNHFRLLVNYNF